MFFLSKWFWLFIFGLMCIFNVQASPKKRYKKGIWAIRRLAYKIPLMRLVYRVRLGGLRQQRRTGLRIRQLGELRAIPYMLGLLRMKEPNRIRGGLIALSYSGLDWLDKVIIPFLSSPNKMVRLGAIEALGRLKEKRAISHLLEMLKRSHRRESIWILRSLAEIGDESLLGRLNKIAKNRRGLPKISLSLARATFGDKKLRAWWRRHLRRRHNHRIGRYLGRWTSSWSRHLLAKMLSSKSISRRIRGARWLAIWLNKERSLLLNVACQKRTLPKRFCRSLHFALKSWLSPSLKLPKPFFVMTHHEQTQALLRLHQHFSSHIDKLSAISALMLGTSYHLDALGEGDKGAFDRDPIFSLDRVDCVTFLEEILALSRNPHLDQAIQYTQKLRYIGGKIAYRYRRHLPLSQWIPSLIKKGILRDITRRVGGHGTQTLIKRITLRSYATRSALRFIRRIGRKNLVVGRFRLPYIPLHRAITRIRYFQEGSIISMLRPNKFYSPDLIFHQGFIIKRDGILYIRHATKVWGGIVDTPFKWYLRSLTRYGRPVMGVHLLKILAPK